MTYVSCYPSPLGEIIMTSGGEALESLVFRGGKYSYAPENAVSAELPVFAETKKWLSVYFDGGIPDFTPPVLLKGSAFRMRVWDILKEIPYGETVTYKYIADRVAAETGKERMSAQAVGGAVGRNPVSLIVPCHRVIGSDGSLTGYAEGLDIKAKLLEMERKTKERKM